METSQALQIIESLADGVDPATGEIFPHDSPYQNPQVLRALFLAIRALEKVEIKEKRQRRLPENAGKAWDNAEDEAFCTSFDNGMTVRQLAQSHQRTEGAINSRLEKLGKITFRLQTSGQG